MNIKGKAGSKERLVEMMQGVNKMKLHEDYWQNNLSNVLNSAFDKLKSGALRMDQGGTNRAVMQSVDDTSYVGINGYDSEGNMYNFNFKVEAVEGDQDGVSNVQDVKLEKFYYQNPQGQKVFDVDEKDLVDFNNQHGAEMYDVIEKYIDVDIAPDEEFDAMTEEIDKKPESDPFGGARQKYQDGMGYGDEKPVNPALRVKAPELEKFVKEEVESEMVEIMVNGYPYYLKKGDATHFYMANNPEAIQKGNAWVYHVRQHQGEPYYEDVAKWLRGGEAPHGKEYGGSLAESTDQDRYEDVVFMQGEEAEEPLNILMNQGRDEAMEYLKQWHSPGQHMGRAELPHGSGDHTYEKDGYHMAWNPYIGYIGLTYDLSQLNEGNGEAELKSKFGNLQADLEFAKLAKSYENLLKMKHSEMRAKDSAQTALSALRDLIADYLRDIKGLNVTGEDVQNFFANMMGKFSSVVAEEEEKVEIEDAPLDPEDKDNDGDFIPGGKADDADVAKYDPQQVLMGMEVELEHTDDPKVALEIAMDHLEELPDYYTRLDKMEKEGEADLEGGSEEKTDVEKENPELYPDGWKDMDGMFMNPEEMPDELMVHADALKDTDQELEDTLLGFGTETPNASEEMDFAAQERDYADREAYKRFQQLDSKAFNMLSDDEKEEYYDLWQEFN